MLSIIAQSGMRLQGNFSTKNIQSSKEKVQLDLRQIQGRLLLSIPQKWETEIYPTDNEATYLVDQWLAAPERCVAWIEMTRSSNVLITAVFFTKQFTFTPEQPLEIIITPAIRRDLLREKMLDVDLIAFFRKEFLHEGFLLSITGEHMDAFSINGKSWRCDIRSSAHYGYETIRLVRTKSRGNNHPVTLLRGMIQFIDEHTASEQLKKNSHFAFQTSIQQKGDYLDRWGIYNDLEMETRKLEAAELGYVAYKSYTYSPGMGGDGQFIFQLSDPVPQTFFQSNLGFEASDCPPVKTPEEDFIWPGKTEYVGQKALRSGNRSRLVIEVESDQVMQLPKSGFLMGSFNGSKQMLRRRSDALRKVKEQRTPLATLSLLLQAGEAPAFHDRKVKALSASAIKKVLGDTTKSFTEAQYDAIGAALNTPDIALIQGPPGTGKTSVIRAIISRIQELSPGAKVLVTSTQHDAVDNAIDGLYSGGLPVNRMGKRRNRPDEDLKDTWRQWTEQQIRQVKDYAETLEEPSSRKTARQMRIHMDICQRNQNNPQNMAEQLEIIYGLYHAIGDPMLSERIVQSLLMVRRWLDMENKHSSDILVKAPPSPEEEVDYRIQGLLESQRLYPDAFMDDGSFQAHRLASYMRRFRPDLTVMEPLLEAIDWPEGQGEGLIEWLPRFRDAIEQLTTFTGPTIVREEFIEATLTMKDIVEVIESLFNALQISLNIWVKENNGTLSDILDAYIEELDNPLYVEEIIGRYTQVSAATCQQSVAKRYKREYDYVIIDEAARSNPLDLMIPMGLGKKIILVGDQKQLPHLLEKDVVNAFFKKMKDPGIRDFLSKTLFERLFDQLKESQNKPGGIARVVTLTDQFRMHPVIGRFVSEQFYSGKLNSPVPAEKKRHELGYYGDKSVAWLNIPGELGREEISGNRSRYRSVEISALMKELIKVLESNEDYTVGVITFYSAQAVKIQVEVDELPTHWADRVAVGSVDAFQGREFDIVYLSTVRSNNDTNKEQRVGFLDSENRLCVAFSRAKRLLVLIGDRKTIAGTSEDPGVEQLAAFYNLCVSEGYYETY